jgi:hypothetical protein
MHSHARFLLVHTLVQEKDGMIKLIQLKGADDRARIDKARVLAGYVLAAREVPSMPTLPQNGFGAQGPYGPWFVYNDLTLCELFKSHHDEIPIQDCEAPPIQLKVEVIDLTESSVKEGKMTSTMVKTLTVHAALRVPHGLLFRRINMKMLKEAWNKYDFVVLKANRAGVKFQGKRIREKGTDSEEYHFDVRPRDGNIWGAKFPEQLVLNVLGTSQYIEYRLFPHPDLNGELCLEHCHRYYPATLRRTGWNLDSCPGHGGKGKGKGAGRGRAASSSIDDLLEAINANSQAKAGEECKWYAQGKCYYTRTKGRKCDFAHTSPLDPGLIPCMHPKKSPIDSACKVKDCAYLHVCAEAEEPDGDADML